MDAIFVLERNDGTLNNTLMPAGSLLHQEWEFYLPEHDNHILVETEAEMVLIRASRDNLSGRAKAFFIHHLAAEGYIPSRFEWYPEGGDLPGVKWVVDRSWIKLDPKIAKRNERQVLKLLGYSIAVWAGIIAIVIFSAR